MKKLRLVSILLIQAFSVHHCFAQVKDSETGRLNISCLSGNHRSMPGNGLYLLIPDSTRSQGFNALNTDDFYCIVTDHKMTFKNIDTVYKEFDNYIKQFTLNFRFNNTGSKELSEFTSQHIGMKVGFFIHNKLLNAATIVESIHSGRMAMSGKFTGKEIDEIIVQIINTAKH